MVVRSNVDSFHILLCRTRKCCISFVILGNDIVHSCDPVRATFIPSYKPPFQYWQCPSISTTIRFSQRPSLEQFRASPCTSHPSSPPRRCTLNPCPHTHSPAICHPYINLQVPFLLPTSMISHAVSHDTMQSQTFAAP
jgi:hypothetical protein